MLPDEYSELTRTGRKRPLFEAAMLPRINLERDAIERLIPHRDPFLLVDRIPGASLDERSIVGQRRLDPADPVFGGHFPDDPIYPGVLQLEIMGQVGLCLFALLHNGRPSVHPQDLPRAVRGLKVHHAAFLAPVRPNDELLILAREVSSNEYTAVCAGQLYSGSTLCCFSVMEVYFVDQ